MIDKFEALSQYGPPMTTTLQEALLKAGLIAKKPQLKDQQQNSQVIRKSQAKPQQEAARPKEEFKKNTPFNHKETSPQKPGFLEGKHLHHVRTDCEACKKSGPDVEYYEHKNRLLTVKWLCMRCADTYKISDDCRQTMQSSFAKAKRFLREWGPTKIFK